MIEIMNNREGIVFNLDDSAQIYVNGWIVFHDYNDHEIMMLPQLEE